MTDLRLNVVLINNFLNVNVLKALNRRQRLAEWMKKCCYKKLTSNIMIKAGKKQKNRTTSHPLL